METTVADRRRRAHNEFLEFKYAGNEMVCIARRPVNPHKVAGLEWRREMDNILKRPWRSSILQKKASSGDIVNLKYRKSYLPELANNRQCRPEQIKKMIEES